MNPIYSSYQNLAYKVILSACDYLRNLARICPSCRTYQQKKEYSDLKDFFLGEKFELYKGNLNISGKDVFYKILYESKSK